MSVSSRDVIVRPPFAWPGSQLPTDTLGDSSFAAWDFHIGRSLRFPSPKAGYHAIFYGNRPN